MPFAPPSVLNMLRRTPKVKNNGGGITKKAPQPHPGGASHDDTIRSDAPRTNPNKKRSDEEEEKIPRKSQAGTVATAAAAADEIVSNPIKQEISTATEVVNNENKRRRNNSECGGGNSSFPTKPEEPEKRKQPKLSNNSTNINNHRSVLIQREDSITVQNEKLLQKTSLELQRLVIGKAPSNVSAETIKRACLLLDRCERMYVTNEFIRNNSANDHIYRTIQQIATGPHAKVLGECARRVLNSWQAQLNVKIGSHGNRWKLLQEYRKIYKMIQKKEFDALQEQYRPYMKGKKTELTDRKPDMQAYGIMNEKYKLKEHRDWGEIEDVPIGLRFYEKGEGAVLGIHTDINKGIDSKKEYPCYAVCVSGAYKDDELDAENDTVVYTGEGGQEKGKQTSDQDERRPANDSLIRSKDQGTPIRLIRRLEGKEPWYQYVGIFKCIEYRYEAGVEGFKVCKFVLKRIK